jgi:hypothetical protein
VCGGTEKCGEILHNHLCFCGKTCLCLYKPESVFIFGGGFCKMKREERNETLRAMWEEMGAQHSLWIWKKNSPLSFPQTKPESVSTHAGKGPRSSTNGRGERLVGSETAPRRGGWLCQS